MSEVVTLRVSPEMAAAITRTAGKRSASDWLRDVISKAAGLSTEPAVGRSMPARLRLIAKQDDVAAFAALARDTARAIGMLKVFAQAMRQSGHKDLHRQAEDTLVEMRRTAREIQSRLATVSK